VTMTTSRPFSSETDNFQRLSTKIHILGPAYSLSAFSITRVSASPALVHS
jgi:hypothetical protein